MTPIGPVFNAALNAMTATDALRERAKECSCALESIRGPLAIYNEEAFLHFLDIERKRSKASNRPFLLVLVDLKQHADVDALSALSRRVFEALSVGLRETDFVGWHREGSVVGAVLTEHSSDVAADVADVVGRRVTRVLTETLPHTLADRLPIRVYQVPPVLQNVSE